MNWESSPLGAGSSQYQIVMLDLVQEQTREQDLVTIIVLHNLNLTCQYADKELLSDTYGIFWILFMTKQVYRWYNHSAGIPHKYHPTDLSSDYQKSHSY